MKYGIDVSHHQGSIDWTKVKAKGITSAGDLPVSFAILKCIYESKSHGTDTCFEKNYSGCINNNIDVGVYVYHGAASLADPAAEARALIKVLNGRSLSYGIWHDLEDDKLKAAGNAAINALLKIQDDIFRAAGYTDIGIYCNKYWYSSVLDVNYLKTIYQRWWIARYLKNDTGVIPSASMSPKSYADIWQFSSKGRVYGINGNVDLDIDYTDLSSGSEIPTPAATESDLGLKMVTAAKLNVRKSPEMGNNIIGTVSRGTKVNVTEISGKWAHIEGWVSTSYIK